MMVVLFFVGNTTYAGIFSSSQQRQAKKILEGTGIKGGLIVHIGCGDGKLTAALRVNERYIVQGLDSSEKNVEQARKYIQSRGIYGAVSVDRLQGNRLPYVDNLVNLVVSENLGDISQSEVMRVLCPNGVGYIRQGNRWKKLIKQRREEIDEWTHYLHDPQGTMVGRDRIVGPPRRLQWVGGPKWLRNHDFMSSLNGMVSSNGRIFYLIDEGLRNHIYLPARWAVVARDAFNGTDLWKRSIEQWFPHTWPFKSGPGYLPRRIVASGDRVYVTKRLCWIVEYCIWWWIRTRSLCFTNMKHPTAAKSETGPIKLSAGQSRARRGTLWLFWPIQVKSYGGIEIALPH
jgi:hypothetical protein